MTSRYSFPLSCTLQHPSRVIITTGYLSSTRPYYFGTMVLRGVRSIGFSQFSQHHRHPADSDLGREIAMVHPSTWSPGVKKAWIGGICLVVAAVVAGFFGLFQNREGSQSTTLRPDDVLTVTSLPANGAVVYGDQSVPISGQLKLPLPGGRQIWAASRGAVSASDDGSKEVPGFGVLALCRVAADNKSFDCGLHQLGGENAQPGRYVVWVGLADSNTAQDMLAAMVDQSARGVWSHKAPAGFESVNPITVERKKLSE